MTKIIEKKVLEKLDKLEKDISFIKWYIIYPKNKKIKHQIQLKKEEISEDLIKETKHLWENEWEKDWKGLGL